MDQSKEQPSTYFVQDRANQQEIERLVYQQFIQETKQSDFFVQWDLLVAWGTR